MNTPAHPWTPAIDASDVRDLSERLTSTRLPALTLLEGWSAGTSPEYLRLFLDEWNDSLDAVALETYLSSLPGFRLEIDGLGIYFLHYRSTTPDATAVLAIHGWPSSILEYVAAAEALSDQGFDVVVPALPGFAFSDTPSDIDDFAASRIATRLHSLMTHLGYDRYLVTGGDIGARIATWLGSTYPASVLGLHVSSNAFQAVEDAPDHDGSVHPLIPSESDWIESRNKWFVPEGAYMHLHQTKPTTLAPALSDSPAALASWLLEKWHDWGSTDMGSPERRQFLQRLLSVYWLSNTAPSSVLPYYAYENAGGARAPGHLIPVPVGFYLSAGEIGGIPPRSLGERRYNLRRWTVFDDGAHFPALDATHLFVADFASFATEVLT